MMIHPRNPNSSPSKKTRKPTENSLISPPQPHLSPSSPPKPLTIMNPTPQTGSETSNPVHKTTKKSIRPPLNPLPCLSNPVTLIGNHHLETSTEAIFNWQDAHRKKANALDQSVEVSRSYSVPLIPRSFACSTKRKCLWCSICASIRNLIRWVMYRPARRVKPTSPHHGHWPQVKTLPTRCCYCYSRHHTHTRLSAVCIVNINQGICSLPFRFSLFS